MKNLLNQIKITRSDLDYIKSYIEERQTAILVIMFTDIVGFTRLTEEKGETYAATLRKSHDDIITSVVERENAGKVIKYIGDSVMAVFSEPTKAVETSIMIQDKLQAFNESHDDLEDINIRIGLHMGQVAIENRIQSDIFGRHVNRASRIESLAGKGQIYLSYPVFDSAKGWLQEMEHISWKSHGEYFLKGIDKPQEIIEVYDKSVTNPKAPSKGKKKRVVPSFVFIILFAVLGGLITFGAISYQKTEVFLFNFMYQDVRTIDGSKIFLDGEDGDNRRLLLTKLKKGSHVLYYDVSAMVRYYTEIDVKRGQNLIEPVFKYSALPGYEETWDFAEGEESFKFELEDKFTYYDRNQQFIQIEEAKFYGDIIKEEVGDFNEYRFRWKLDFDGVNVGSGEDSIKHNRTTDDYERTDFNVVLELENFNFEIKYSTFREILKVNFIGVWN